MFGKTWKTSERKYKVLVEEDVKIKMSDGVEINCDIHRPDSKEKFPAILGCCPYFLRPQSAFITPSPISTPGAAVGGQEKHTGYLEAGDPYFYVPRGYAKIVYNVRGSGKSGGKYQYYGQREMQDGVEVIDWIAKQPWCDGNVGMFGASYFAISQYFIAALHPPQLKCCFAPWACTDLYRQWIYKGGIMAHGFLVGWLAGSIDKVKPDFQSRKSFNDSQIKEAIAERLQDGDITAVPGLLAALQNPDAGPNPVIADLLLNPYDGPFWQERLANVSAIKVPTYTGADWATYGLHLPGAFRNWENLKVPKKMIIGPPLYAERPLYQLQYESLRWFDHWLKGMDTKIMEEPPIRYFLMGTREWRAAEEWPLPETKWTPFYLHENSLLWEHEFYPNEGYDSFNDSPWNRGFLEYSTPTFVEDTEVVGPLVLNLYASTTDDEIFWFISIREVDKEGNEKILTRGWLRGSHRKVDPKRSKPWEPYHPHTKSEPLKPGEIYEFNIGIVPIGNLFKAGSKLKLKIFCKDDPPTTPLEGAAVGHIWRQSASRITVYHDSEHPSHLLVPVTKGNILGTFLSGGKPYM